MEEPQAAGNPEHQHVGHSGQLGPGGIFVGLYRKNTTGLKIQLYMDPTQKCLELPEMAGPAGEDLGARTPIGIRFDISIG